MKVYNILNCFKVRVTGAVNVLNYRLELPS